MPKSSTMQIVKDEQKVLEVLQTNAKESIDALAKKCGFSRQKVWRIIKKFEKEKIIWGYTAITDSAFNNMKHFTLLIKRTSQPLQQKDIDSMFNNPFEIILPGYNVQIETIQYVNGSYDWIVNIQAESIQVAKKFIEQFYTKHKNLVKEVHLIETLFFIRKNNIKNPQERETLHFI